MAGGRSLCCSLLNSPHQARSQCLSIQTDCSYNISAWVCRWRLPQPYRKSVSNLSSPHKQMHTDLLMSYLQIWCFSAPLKYTKIVYCANSVLYQIEWYYTYSTYKYSIGNKGQKIRSKVTNFALCVPTLRRMIYVWAEWMLCVSRLICRSRESTLYFTWPAQLDEGTVCEV